MIQTELGACEWFVWDLRRSNLLELGQLEQAVGEFLGRHPRAEPAQLAEYLVQRGLLTRFQAERLLNGKSEGFVLGPYVLVDALGTGSMGTVYKARSRTQQGWFALKVLPRRSMWNMRVARRRVREFEQVRHQAVVAFIDVGTAGGAHYLVWPFIEGTTLESIVKEKGRLRAEDVIRIGLDIAAGLDAAHRHNLIHGLLKPSDIMVTSDHQVKILDFGIGCLLLEMDQESVVDTMSSANTLTSGLDCASPEAILDPSNTTPASDQYSLGCVLYYCLTGQFPFPTGNSVEKMMAHQTKKPCPISELAPGTPDALVRVLERLMEKQPEKRYPATSDVVMALQALLPSRNAPGAFPGSASSLRSKLAQTAIGVPHAPATDAEKEAPTSFTSSRFISTASVGAGPEKPAPTMKNRALPKESEQMTEEIPALKQQVSKVRPSIAGAETCAQEQCAPAPCSGSRGTPKLHENRADEGFGLVAMLLVAALSAFAAWLVAWYWR